MSNYPNFSLCFSSSQRERGALYLLLMLLGKVPSSWFGLKAIIWTGRIYHPWEVEETFCLDQILQTTLGCKLLELVLKASNAFRWQYATFTTTVLHRNCQLKQQHVQTIVFNRSEIVNYALSASHARVPHYNVALYCQSSL